MAARPVGASAALGVVADSAMAVGVSSAALDVVVAEVTEVEPDVAAAEVVAAPDVAAAKVAVVPAAAAVSSPSLRRFAAPALPRGSPAPRGLIQTLHSTKSFLPGCAFFVRHQKIPVCGLVQLIAQSDATKAALSRRVRSPRTQSRLNA